MYRLLRGGARNLHVEIGSGGGRKFNVQTISCFGRDAVAIACGLCLLWAFMCFGRMGGNARFKYPLHSSRQLRTPFDLVID